jgi:hypothetical protein
MRAVIHDRRIEVPAPEGLADGTEVILTIDTEVVDDNGPMSSREISRVLAAMSRLEPLDIPNDVATDLETWEKKLNQYSIDHADEGGEGTSR